MPLVFTLARGLIAGPRDERAWLIACLAIGPIVAFTLVALSGEVVVEYVKLIEEALGPNRLWVAAYSQDVYGYLPSARILREGGYETRGLYSGGLGQFFPAAEGVLVAKVRQLAQEAGRKP